jgi:predicted HTH domain antitoxin
MAGVTIPDAVLSESGLTEERMSVEVALELYRREKLTMGQAMRLAGTDRIGFWGLMASRDIYMHYDVEDLEQDIATLRSLGRL